ncbi:hypothetical protein [Sphingomonas sp. LHG3443-2]|uniref:hypothetical protein n=1 Tax=Sphingomonas sp. LHG3443-2 TaxID=2804639 RepID=UPI003CFB368B
MVTYSFSVGGVNREAVAQEVLGSAAKILLLTGYSEDEVGELFQQAAGQMLSGEAVGRIDDAGDFAPDENALDEVDIWSLAQKFEDHTAVKALNRLNKRASTLDDLDDPQALAKAIALLTEAIRLRHDAITWLRTEAAEAGIEVVGDREEWIASATDDQLDQEDSLLFLDDYRWSGDFNWYLVGQVARALAETGDREALTSFSSVVLSDNLGLQVPVREEVERSVETISSYEDFSRYVRSHSSAGELAQAEFLDRFIRQTGFSNGTYPLERWLDAMSRRGELERYKRANRWRILVP